MRGATVRVCESCGGGNISRKVYQDVNDFSIIESVDDSIHCWDCNDDTGDVDALQYQREQREYEADFAADCAKDDALERGR